MTDAAVKGRMPRGEDNASSKLTEKDVLSIRKRHKRNHKVHGTNPLAREFGVTPDAIYKITSRQTWRHL